MGKNTQRLRAACLQLKKRDDGLRFGNIRPGRLKYALAYVFELLLFSTRGHFLPTEVTFLGMKGQIWLMIAHGAASLIVMLLWSRRFRPLVHTSVAVCVAGFLPFVFLPVGQLRLLFGVIAYAGLGGAVTSARCGYAFALNNAERLFSIVGMHIVCSFIRFADSQTFPPAAAKALLLAFLAGMCVCLLCFKEEDLEVKEHSTRADTRGVYWALAYFIAYFSVDGYIWTIVDTDVRPNMGWQLCGALLSAAVLILMLGVLRVNVWHVWNVFFLSAVAMGLFAVFAPRIGTEKPAYFFGGLSVLGWPLCMYMLACAHRCFADYRLLKKCTLIFCIVSPVTSLADELIENFAPSLLPAAALTTVLLFVVLSLIFSPYSYQYLFSAEWFGRIHNRDMPAPEPAEAPEPLPAAAPVPADPFAAFDLTPRQKEVAGLLLEARTRRQIAGELGLSESTVKTHTAELYKKLGINSRVELFRLFGVASQPPEE